MSFESSNHPFGGIKISGHWPQWAIPPGWNAKYHPRKAITKVPADAAAITLCRQLTNNVVRITAAISGYAK